MRERGGRDAVHRDEDLDVVIEDGAALGLVDGGRQVRAAGRLLHHDPARLVAEAVDVGDRDAVGLEHAHHLVLVLERVDAVLLGAAVAAEVDADALAGGALDLEEPGGAPALLGLGGDDAAAGEGFDLGEGGEPLGGGHICHAHLHVRLASVAHSAEDDMALRRR